MPLHRLYSVPGALRLTGKVSSIDNFPNVQVYSVIGALRLTGKVSSILKPNTIPSVKGSISLTGKTSDVTYTGTRLVTSVKGGLSLRTYRSGITQYGPPIDTGSYTISRTYIEITSTYTPTALNTSVNCTSGTFNVDLLSAATITGKIYNIKNSGSGIITVNPYGSEALDEELAQLLYPGECISIQSTGVNWIIL
jgi:hypothetical protein